MTLCVLRARRAISWDVLGDSVGEMQDWERRGWNGEPFWDIVAALKVWRSVFRQCIIIHWQKKIFVSAKASNKDEQWHRFYGWSSHFSARNTSGIPGLKHYIIMHEQIATSGFCCCLKALQSDDWSRIIAYLVIWNWKIAFNLNFSVAVISAVSTTRLVTSST